MPDREVPAGDDRSPSAFGNAARPEDPALGAATPPPPAGGPPTTAAPRFCPQCGSEYEPGLNFCPRDGNILQVRHGEHDLVGQVLGRHYRILELLGEGGMGQVFLAEHVRIGRRCAIKVMRPALTRDSGAVGRFGREATTAGRISHRNAAAVYDFGETEDGLIYIVMEHVEGPPLSQVLAREGALAPARALDIAQQLTAALTAAHRLGIVHRDLKPDNILLARDEDGADLVKVVDFGIAKAMNHDSEQSLTRTGFVLGTLQYMSPEQLIGEPLDGRSDLYSVGCILFEMLTGERTFAGPSGPAAIARRLTEPPPSPRTRKPELTEELDAIVVRALGRTPAERFQSAEEMRAALLRVLDAGAAGGAETAGPLAARPASTIPPAPRPLVAPLDPRTGAESALPTPRPVPPPPQARPAAGPGAGAPAGPRVEEPAVPPARPASAVPPVAAELKADPPSPPSDPAAELTWLLDADPEEEAARPMVAEATSPAAAAASQAGSEAQPAPGSGARGRRRALAAGVTVLVVAAAAFAAERGWHRAAGPASAPPRNASAAREIAPAPRAATAEPAPPATVPPGASGTGAASAASGAASPGAPATASAAPTSSAAAPATITIAGRLPTGAVVLLDGSPVRGTHVTVGAGRHTVAVVASGYLPFEWTGSLAAGEHRRWTADLQRRPPALAPTPATRPAAPPATSSAAAPPPAREVPAAPAGPAPAPAPPPAAPEAGTGAAPERARALVVARTRAVGEDIAAALTARDAAALRRAWPAIPADLAQRWQTFLTSPDNRSVQASFLFVRQPQLQDSSAAVPFTIEVTFDNRMSGRGVWRSRFLAEFQRTNGSWTLAQIRPEP